MVLSIYRHDRYMRLSPIPQATWVDSSFRFFWGRSTGPVGSVAWFMTNCQGQMHHLHLLSCTWNMFRSNMAMNILFMYAIKVFQTTKYTQKQAMPIAFYRQSTTIEALNLELASLRLLIALITRCVICFFLGVKISKYMPTASCLTIITSLSLKKATSRFQNILTI